MRAVRERPAQQEALFLAEGSDALNLDGLGTLPTTPAEELDLPRELAPGVIAYPKAERS